MNRFVRRSLVAAAILTAVSACGHAVPAPPPVPFYEPDVALRDVRLRGVGLFGGTLDLWMRVYNPNTYDIMSPHVGYVVMVDRVQVASGVADLDVVVPAGDSMEVRVPADFRYAELGPAGRAIVGRGAAMYHVTGRVSVSTPYGWRSFPYDRVGQYGVVDARLGPPGRDDGRYARDARDGREHDAYDHDSRDSRDRSYVRDGHDHGGHGYADDDPPRDRGANAGQSDPPRRSAPPEAAPPGDTPRGPDVHDRVAREPGKQDVRIGNPGEEHHPRPVTPGQPAPPRTAAPAQPGLPGSESHAAPADGASNPPAHDSSAHSAHPEHPVHPVHPAQAAHPAPPARGGKPCVPAEPNGRGASGNAQQQGRRTVPPCAAPDTSRGAEKH